jgi:hypothetical protein
MSVLAALAMLILGETVLKERLTQLEFVFYWLLCFIFTGLAIILAFLDVRALQQRTRHEHRELMNTTLKEIEGDAKAKRRNRN